MAWIMRCPCIQECMLSIRICNEMRGRGGEVEGTPHEQRRGWRKVRYRSSIEMRYPPMSRDIAVICSSDSAGCVSGLHVASRERRKYALIIGLRN